MNNNPINATDPTGHIAKLINNAAASYYNTTSTDVSGAQGDANGGGMTAGSQNLMYAALGTGTMTDAIGDYYYVNVCKNGCENLPSSLRSNVTAINQLIVDSGNQQWIDQLSSTSYHYVNSDPYDANNNRIPAEAKNGTITYYKGSLGLTDYGTQFVTAHEFAHLLPVGKPDSSSILYTPNYEAAADQFAINLLGIPPTQRLPKGLDLYFNNANPDQRRRYYPGR